MSDACIRDYLSYDPETGVFRWIAKPKGRGYPFKVGDVAGCVRGDGRHVICFAGRNYLAHVLAWLFVYGELPSHEIDHWDRNPGNNRISNLRPATREEQMLNTLRHRDAAHSRFKGVTLHRKTGKWAARFRSKHLGLFETEEAAARAYDQAAMARSPAYARPNLPNGG